MTGSEAELVDKTRDPDYRLFVSGLSVEAGGLATESPGQTARAKIRGKFMGSGDLVASASFQPRRRNGVFEMQLQIAPTPMTTLNDLFRAWGKFDVFAGDFSLFSEIRVQDRYMRGYVKPIFANVEIYDSRQDAQKPLLKKVYEGILDAASKILENRKRDQVATKTSVEGPLGNAKTSTWEILGGVLKNAFVKAILPGFDRQVGTHRRN